MKILCCGDRNWSDYLAVKSVIESIKPTCIVQGEAHGADSCAKRVARELYLLCKSYPADWQTHGKSAGPIRNRQMLKDNPDINLVVAFHDYINESRGTKDMINIAKKSGIQVILYKHVLIGEKLN